jgi:hypothetical protein
MTSKQIKKEDTGSTQSEGRPVNVKTEVKKEGITPGKKVEKSPAMQELTNRFLEFKKKMNDELV